MKTHPHQRARHKSSRFYCRLMAAQTARTTAPNNTTLHQRAVAVERALRVRWSNRFTF